MKYRKIKYKENEEKGKTEEYSLLYNKNKSKYFTKSLIGSYILDENKIVYNYNINNMKINTPKLYAIKLGIKYLKSNIKKLIKKHNDYIFNVKDIKKNIIYGPYVLYTFLGDKKKIMWHLGKYKIH